MDRFDRRDFFIMIGSAAVVSLVPNSAGASASADYAEIYHRARARRERIHRLYVRFQSSDVDHGRLKTFEASPIATGGNELFYTPARVAVIGYRNTFNLIEISSPDHATTKLVDVAGGGEERTTFDGPRGKRNRSPDEILDLFLPRLPERPDELGRDVADGKERLIATSGDRRISIDPRAATVVMVERKRSRNGAFHRSLFNDFRPIGDDFLFPFTAIERTIAEEQVVRQYTYTVIQASLNEPFPASAAAAFGGGAR
jgi:hypothetical protein